MFHDWYSIVDSENISQGDIFFNFPILVPSYDIVTSCSESEKIVNCDSYQFDVIVLTQACDLEVRPGDESPKSKFVLVADLTNARTLDQINKDAAKELLSLKRTNLFLLEASEKSIKMDYEIVHFDYVNSVPWTYINEFCKQYGQHLRLKSPYMEALSHHFGNYFSRVSTPENRVDSLNNYWDKRKQYITCYGKDKWYQLSSEQVMEALT